MPITILGSSGFIGSNLKRYLETTESCYCPKRGDQEIFSRDLGQVFYCVGLTADFRSRPYETVAAHINFLQSILERCTFESLIYLSSTRVYGGTTTSKEGSALSVNPNNQSDFYNISKLMGESLCLRSERKEVKVARLSNVCGLNSPPENFLSSVIKEAIQNKKVTIHTSLDAQKDFINIDDVVALLPKILFSGKERIYNIASGENTSLRDLLELLRTKIDFFYEEGIGKTSVTYPMIDIAKIKDEFNFSPSYAQDFIPKLATSYLKEWQK